MRGLAALGILCVALTACGSSLSNEDKRAIRGGCDVTYALEDFNPSVQGADPGPYGEEAIALSEELSRAAVRIAPLDSMAATWLVDAGVAVNNLAMAFVAGEDLTTASETFAITRDRALGMCKSWVESIAD